MLKKIATLTGYPINGVNDIKKVLENQRFIVVEDDNGELVEDPTYYKTYHILANVHDK